MLTLVGDRGGALTDPWRKFSCGHHARSAGTRSYLTRHRPTDFLRTPRTRARSSRRRWCQRRSSTSHPTGSSRCTAIRRHSRRCGRCSRSSSCGRCKTRQRARRTTWRPGATPPGPAGGPSSLPRGRLEMARGATPFRTSGGPRRSAPSRAARPDRPKAPADATRYQPQHVSHSRFSGAQHGPATWPSAPRSRVLLRARCQLGKPTARCVHRARPRSASTSEIKTQRVCPSSAHCACRGSIMILEGVGISA